MAFSMFRHTHNPEGLSVNSILYDLFDFVVNSKMFFIKDILKIFSFSHKVFKNIGEPVFFLDANNIKILISKISYYIDKFHINNQDIFGINRFFFRSLLEIYILESRSTNTNLIFNKF